MKTSIITVCYNSASTIINTLHSVAQQSNSNIEHVVIDGGSKDGTVDLVRQHGTHVSTLVSEPDRGIYDAMNKGLRASSGDLICFLNADDRYSHTEVLASVSQQMEHENLDALLGDVAFFHADAPDRMVRRYRSARFKPERLGWGWMPSHPALFVRRAVFDRVGPFRTDLKIAGDYDWVVRAFKAADLRYQYRSEVLVHMQIGGISTRGWRNTLLLNQEVIRACRDNGISTNWFKILSKYPVKLLEYLDP